MTSLANLSSILRRNRINPRQTWKWGGETIFYPFYEESIMPTEISKTLQGKKIIDD
jgi:hypothetical protein